MLSYKQMIKYILKDMGIGGDVSPEIRDIQFRDIGKGDNGFIRYALTFEVREGNYGTKDNQFL